MRPPTSRAICAGCRAGPVHTAAQGRVQAGLGGDNPAQLGPLRRRAGCSRPRRRHPRGAHYRFQISSSSGGSRNRILLAVAERALARTDGRSRSTVIVSGVSPGPAATAASRRTCGGWAETGLGQPWSSWPSAREAGPSRPTGVRVDERAVDVEVGTVKACRHGGSLPCCSSGSAPPPASHPSTRSRKNRGSRQASTPRPTSEAIGCGRSTPGPPVLPTGLIPPSESTRRSSRRSAAPGSVAQCRVPSD
jgi:hypothetical protein